MPDPSHPNDFVQRILSGELVKNAKTAIAIAEILVESNYGEMALTEQNPLIAQDNATSWIVEGSLNGARSTEGLGRLIVQINKADAKTTSLIFDYVIHPLQSAPKQ